MTIDLARAQLPREALQVAVMDMIRTIDETVNFFTSFPVNFTN